MDPILFWNDVAVEVHRRDYAFDSDPATGKEIGPQQGGPTRTSRALAIVHIAMYDAWNGAKATGNNYLGQGGRPVLPTAPAGTPLTPAARADVAAGVAVSGAAVTTLKALFSNQLAYIEAQMLKFCSTLSGLNVTPAEISSYEDYGRRVAEVLLALRSNDGSAVPESYVAGGSPGDHRPDPYNGSQGYLGSRWGRVTPFCVSSPVGPGALTTYLDPPPAFGEPRYARDFKEVRDHGAKQRNKRSPLQEMTGLYWAYDGAKGLGTPPRLYNQIARKIVEALSSPPSTDQLARLFAMLHASMADAGIVAWEAKYTYNFWRPVVGIREDDVGTGPTGLGALSSETGDPAWEPNGAPNSNRPGAKNFTPPFPAYPSGHATFGTTMLEVVRKFFNLDETTFKFKFVSDELNGSTVGIDGSTRTRVEREYTIKKAIKENLESRVWLGVHWRFDGDAGETAGRKIADQVVTGTCFP
jgi:acyl-CoA-binding protein